MIIIADHRIPAPARELLKKYGELVPFQTSGIVYEAVSGHPDLFLCFMNSNLVVAPNLPVSFQSILTKNDVPFVVGESKVGPKYPGTAAYNAVFDGQHLIHNFRYTDSSLTHLAEDFDLVHVNQGYTACNLLALGNNRYITSDRGIHRTLEQLGSEIVFADPSQIQLPGVKHGFFGGCCGIYEDTVFLIGSLADYGTGATVRKFIQDSGYSIIELYEGPLFDGGGLLFLPAPL